VDHPSLRFPEQENLYSSDLVQGPCLFSGKCFFWFCCLYEVLILPEMRSELEFVGNKYLLFSMLEGQEIKKKTLNE
jgi:hypothetical protein